MRGKNRKLTLAFSGLAVTMLACNALVRTFESPTAQTQQEFDVPTALRAQGTIPKTEEQVPRISAKEAKTAFDSGQAVIVDVRSAGYYSESHIAGAISIPLDEIEKDPNSAPLEKDQWIITYCT